MIDRGVWSISALCIVYPLPPKVFPSKRCIMQFGCMDRFVRFGTQAGRSRLVYSILLAVYISTLPREKTGKFVAQAVVCVVAAAVPTLDADDDFFYVSSSATATLPLAAALLPKIDNLAMGYAGVIVYFHVDLALSLELSLEQWSSNRLFFHSEDWLLEFISLVNIPHALDGDLGIMITSKSVRVVFDRFHQSNPNSSRPLTPMLFIQLTPIHPSIPCLRRGWVPHGKHTHSLRHALMSMFERTWVS